MEGGEYCTRPRADLAESFLKLPRFDTRPTVHWAIDRGIQPSEGVMGVLRHIYGTCVYRQHLLWSSTGVRHVCCTTLPPGTTSGEGEIFLRRQTKPPADNTRGSTIVQDAYSHQPSELEVGPTEEPPK